MQVTKGTWRMREQCVPGSLSSSPAQEPGNEASNYTNNGTSYTSNVTSWTLNTHWQIMLNLCKALLRYASIAGKTISKYYVS